MGKISMRLYIFRCRTRPRMFGATRYETASNLPTNRCTGGWEFYERLDLTPRGILRYAVDTGTVRRLLQQRGWHVWDESPRDGKADEPEAIPVFAEQNGAPDEPDGEPDEPDNEADAEPDNEPDAVEPNESPEPLRTEPVLSVPEQSGPRANTDTVASKDSREHSRASAEHDEVLERARQYVRREAAESTPSTRESGRRASEPAETTPLPREPRPREEPEYDPLETARQYLRKQAADSAPVSRERPREEP